MSLNKLSNQRKTSIARIVETHNLGIKSKTDPSVKLVFRAAFESLEDDYDNFKQLHNQIIGLVDDTAFDEQDAIRKETDNFYYKTKATYADLYPTGSLQDSTPTHQRDDLGPLKVPTFDGNPRKWPTFHDIYISLVHDNPNYSDIRKFQHLLSFLVGEPSNLLNSIKMTANNYQIAWKTLTDRYQNTRLLASTYWNAIYNANTLRNNSCKELRKLIDTFSENVSALENLNFPVQSWCFCLFSILLSKLDHTIRTAFEVKYCTTEIPTYKNLIEFLTNHCKALESVQTIPSQNVTSAQTTKSNSKQNSLNPSTSKTNSYYSNSNYKSSQPYNLLVNAPPPSNRQQNNPPIQKNQNSNSYGNKCKLCNNFFHPLSQCPAFISKSPSDRFTFIKQQNACINCLRFNHLLKDCISTLNCKICRVRHHTMLCQQNPNQISNHINSNQNSTNINQNPIHFNSNNCNSAYNNSNQSNSTQTLNNPNLDLSLTQPRSSSSNVVLHQNQMHNESLIHGSYSNSIENPMPQNGLCTSLSSFSYPTTVLLSTIKIQVLDSRGNFQTIRAILDSGSQANLISEKCLNRLGLSRRKLSIPVLGVNQSSSATSGVSTCTIRPLKQMQPTFTFEVFVLPNLCVNMPSIHIDHSNWNHISNLNLADDKFNIPGPVDMLLGAELYTQIFKAGRIPGNYGQPTAYETVFGWVLLGKTMSIATHPSINSYFTSCEESLDSSIRKFWELETVKPKVYFSPEEQKCEEIFRKTTIREPSGRFIVNLPFRHSEPDLGDTFSTAYRSFKSLESKLLKNPELYTLYSNFMKDYINNGHMSLIPPNNSKPIHSCYLSHHGVLRLEKQTSKIRVVFNPSMKGSKGISLNETLLIGPKLQNDISEILLKFRFHSIVFITDIKQHFLQIKINPPHRDYQRLLWRFDPSESIQEFRLNTVTFGVSSSPYLAIRTLRELATLESQNYPEASQILLENTFMDDICAGAESVEDALALQKDLIALLKLGGFELRKWASNNPNLLLHLAPSDCQIPVPFENDESTSVKVLGLQWHPSSDTFTYSCNPSENSCTKRNILSAIAKIWDPLGFLSPVSFYAKTIMQKLWLCNISWDEEPPESILNNWIQFRKELHTLCRISLPRYIFSEQLQHCQLFAFCDASELGYSSCIYLRIELPNDEIKSTLVIGKSRVAPLHTKSIPRLELLGATLLSDLLELVIRKYSPLITLDEIFAFSDSMVTLHWVTASPHRWKTFVANRVSHIQEAIPKVPWYHIPSEENPADCASRGLTPKNLCDHPLWFHGPPWITLPRSEWKFERFRDQSSDILLHEVSEEEKPTILLTQIHPDFFERLINKFSNLYFIQKILCHFRRATHNRKTESIPKLSGQFSAIELHEAMLVLVKRVQEECFLDIISKIKNQKSLPKPLRKLSPFLDESGFVRVGGRLKHSNDLTFEAKHPLLLPRTHRLTDLIIIQTHNNNFHSGPTTILYLIRQKFWILSARRAINSILSKCVRCFRCKPKPYTPFMADLPSFRASQLKCFSHVCLDYAGPITIAASRQRKAPTLKAYIAVFVDTCVKAIHIELVSDLTTEAFMAALRRFVARRGTCVQISSDCGTNFVGAVRELQKLSKSAAEGLHIKWCLNSPGAPHFNGLAEAGVKSIKTHLYKTIGNQIFTFEELYTLLTQIEALLNSRPICEQSSDPNDLSPLTPGHFITMEPLNSCPDPDLTALKINSLSRWQLIQRLHSDFWKRWRNEYLNTLQQRSKWNDPAVEIKQNSLVLIKDETKPPLRWLLGRIVFVHPGRDNQVRVVTVKTQHGLLVRPVVKLCPLPLDPR